MDDTKTVFKRSLKALISLNQQLRNPARAYCSHFSFKGNDQQKIIGQLSGGERNRVHLAKLLKAGGNVLLLDEPTNDLDVETRALEEALASSLAVQWLSRMTVGFLDRITAS